MNESWYFLFIGVFAGLLIGGLIHQKLKEDWEECSD